MSAGSLDDLVGGERLQEIERAMEVVTREAKARLIINIRYSYQ